MSRRMVVRVDGHKGIGMGHIYRMLTLAKYLRRYYSFDIVFVTRSNRAALALIKSNQFAVIPLKFNVSRYEELALIKKIIVDFNPAIVVIDLLKRCYEKEFMQELRFQGKVCTVVFTDAHDKREIESDVVINTSFRLNPEEYQHIKGTRYYLGLDYVILPSGYLSMRNRPKRRSNSVKKVLICMGGSDHHNLTFTVLDSIDKSNHEFSCDVVVSSAFFQKDKVNRFVRKLRHNITVYYDMDGILERLKRADLAITSGGTVHVERMCSGVPGIVINQLRHQCILSRKASEMGISVDLGYYHDVRSENLVDAIDALLANSMLRERMSNRGRWFVDGKGLERAARILSDNCC